MNLRAGEHEKKFRPMQCALIRGGVKREGVKARAHASRCRKVRGSCPTKRDIAVADGGGEARAHSHSRPHQRADPDYFSPSLDAMEQSGSARVYLHTTSLR